MDIGWLETTITPFSFCNYRGQRLQLIASGLPL